MNDDTRTRYDLTVNGITYQVEAPYSRSLLRAVRDDLGLTGTKEGCDDSECGACMVLLDGRPANSCSYLAAQAAGRQVTTVEGLPALATSDSGASDGGPVAISAKLAPLQEMLLEAGGVQCGFCTPGMLISATALITENPDPTEDEIRIALGGNLCRCTGYQRIIDAVQMAAKR